MAGNKHSFYSAIFIENFNSVIGYTYNGALYLWREKSNSNILKKEMKNSGKVSL